MNTAWQLMPQERLREWRKWRKSIESLEDEDCLQAVVDWWKFTPIGSKAIDPYTRKDWPDPWELIFDNNFDENAVALGMAYTLHLMEWPCEVVLLQDTEKAFIGLVVIVDETYVLGYNYGIVDNIKELENCSVLNRWSTDDLV